MFPFFRRLLNHRIGIENPQQPENQNNMINMTQPQPESFIARDLRLRMERSRVNDALQLQATRERERNGRKRARKDQGRRGRPSRDRCG